MALKQLTIFVENKQGTVVEVTKALAANDINIRALSIAETEGFGILRLIVDNQAAAESVLAEAGYLIKTTDVVGVKIGDAPGKLSGARIYHSLETFTVKRSPDLLAVCLADCCHSVFSGVFLCFL